jgi:hypothetical protein
MIAPATVATIVAAAIVTPVVAAATVVVTIASAVRFGRDARRDAAEGQCNTSGECENLHGVILMVAIRIVADG